MIEINREISDEFFDNSPETLKIQSNNKEEFI